jgi:hypothetical protein
MDPVSFLLWSLHVGVSVNIFVVDLAYQGKDIVFRFIIEYSSFRDFGPYVIIIIIIIIGLLLCEDF